MQASISSRNLVAQQKYLEAHYILGDFSEVEINGNYAYVMASGLFNPRLSESPIFLRRSIERMYEIC